MCSITHLCPLMLLLHQTTISGPPVRKRFAQHWRNCRTSQNCTWPVRVEMCSGVARSESSARASGEGPGEEQGEKQWWWSVIGCSPARLEGSSRVASTGKGSGQTWSTSVSGGVECVGFCVQIEVCVHFACVCVWRERGEGEIGLIGEG